MSGRHWQPRRRRQAGNHTAANDETAILWDVGTGEKLRTFSDDHKKFQQMSVSDDGKRLALGMYGDSEFVLLFDVATGAKLQTFVGPDDYLAGLKLSGDGKRLLTAYRNVQNSPRLWDADSGQEIRKLANRADVVTSLSLSADGKWIAVGSRGDSAMLWNTTSSANRALKGHYSDRIGVSLSETGKQVATTHGDCAPATWSCDTGAKIREFRQDGFFNYEDVSLSSDGGRLATINSDKMAVVLNCATGEKIHQYAGSGNDFDEFSFFKRQRPPTRDRF